MPQIAPKPDEFEEMLREGFGHTFDEDDEIITVEHRMKEWQQAYHEWLGARKQRSWRNSWRGYAGTVSRAVGRVSA